jgi:hypothetical protein
MASQISHIIYAKKLFDRMEDGNIHNDFFDQGITKKILMHRDAFLLGCTFPDIRTIVNGVSRKDTHMFFSQVNLDFRGLTPFQAGWKFHIYCDMKREEILNKYAFYELTKEVEKSWLANKMLEDELVYASYNNWEKLSYYFNNIPKVDVLPEISQEMLEFWYSLVARYIEQNPSDKTIHIFISKTKQPDIQKADRVLKGICELRKIAGVSEILKKIYIEII